MVFKEGSSGKFGRYNSYTNNSYLSNLSETLSNVITVVRVKEILLSERDEFLFSNFGGWNGLGTIKYENLDKNAQTLVGYAKPIDPHTKKYPLINELVYIIIAPNTDLGANPYATNAYYINTVSLWNHPHHNGYPDNSNNLPPSQKKDYTQTQVGSVRRVTDNSTEIFLGNTFKERANIHPLLSFEGDIIYEGRWGNSIRLGSTIEPKSNDWSSTGNSGDPIIIIRNGQGEQTEQGWIPIVENININESSIYLTSTQKIPLNISPSYVSYNKDVAPESPKEYSGAQIILNSGRLVFNSTYDHILLSSAKSVGFNALESVNIDTKKFITQADKIFLGKEDQATEPLLLGNTTAQLLRDLISSVKDLANVLENLVSDPVAPNSPATFSSLLVPTAKTINALESLENQLGSTPESCTITSKRNFTV